MDQADAGASALSEKVNDRSAWLPIETRRRTRPFCSHIWRGVVRQYVKQNAQTSPDILGWAPLPTPPPGRVNFSNDAERDGVSLKPYTSSQPASEAGKLSTDGVAK